MNQIKFAWIYNFQSFTGLFERSTRSLHVSHYKHFNAEIDVTLPRVFSQ